MPPKKKTKGGVVQKLRKEIRVKKQDVQKHIDLKDLTEELIQNTTQIKTLKEWGKRLGTANLKSYTVKGKNVDKLKEALIVDLRKLKDVTVKEVGLFEDIAPQDNEDLIKQYKALDAYIISYSINPKKTTTIYGKAGEEFLKIWNTYTSEKRGLFVLDYLELNKEPNKVNAVVYLQKFNDSLTDERNDPVSLTIRYLRLFLKNSIEQDDKLVAEMEELLKNPMLPVDFLNKFRELTPSSQIIFAGRYIRSGGLAASPMDSLQIHLTPQEPAPIITPTQEIYTRGFKREYPTIKGDEKLQQNNYKKCVAVLRNYNWRIRPVSDNVPEKWLGIQENGEEKGDSFHIPTDDFFLTLCQFHSHIQSPAHPYIVIHTDKKIVVEVKDINPSNLSKDLQKAQTGNIFVKLHPYWILNSPLYTVDIHYLDQLTIILGLWTNINFNSIIYKLRKDSWNDTFETYMLRFFILFAPFIPNNLKKPFAVEEQLKRGYFTHEAYYYLSLDKKITDVDSTKMIKAITDWVTSSKYMIISMADRVRSKLPILVLSEDMFLSTSEKEVKCPEGYEHWDLIYHDKKCFVLPLLLKQFAKKDYSYPDDPQKLFPTEFVQDLSNRYQIAAKEFERKGKDGKIEKFYIDEELYKAENPVIKIKKKKADIDPNDISAQFDDYFQLTHVIPDPVALIKNLMTFVPTTTCTECKLKIGESGVKSLINRSDGSIVPISFCDYQCMAKHDFTPMYTVEENEYKFSQETIVDKV